MHLSPDQIVFWHYGWLTLNATIVFTWGLMLVLAVGSRLDHAQALHGSEAFPLAEPPGNHRHRDREANRRHRPSAIRRSTSAFWARSSCSSPPPASCTVIPGYEPPTGSLSTTAALALCVFVAVPLFGIGERGLGGYLKSYVEPTFIMLPFNIISEVSRTLALAVRLFGNMMSGAMIIGILLTITPFIFPIVMTALGLLTGMVQAYIFSILAAVYIAAATRARKPRPEAAPSHVTRERSNQRTSPWTA